MLKRADNSCPSQTDAQERVNSAASGNPLGAKKRLAGRSGRNRQDGAFAGDKASFAAPNPRGKNRLLHYLEQRREPIAFDHVAETPPRVARFIAHLTQQIPVWIACRSEQRKEIGHIWEHLYNFTRIEVPPLTLVETSALIGKAVASRRIQADACQHSLDLYQISKGVPGALEELLVELAARITRWMAPSACTCLSSIGRYAGWQQQPPNYIDERRTKGGTRPRTALATRQT